MKQNIFKKLMLIALLLTSNAVWAYDFESGGIYYNITSSENKTVEVTYSDTNNNSHSSKVVIPATVPLGENLYTVTSIGDRAFNHSALTSITIEEGVTSIGEDAFNECTFLTYIELPSTITNIGNAAFFCNYVIDGFQKREVKCSAETPPTLGVGAFEGNEITLEIPFNSIPAYKAIERWSTIENESVWGYSQHFTYKSKEHEGLYYLPISETEVEVKPNPSKYTGQVVIPSEITVDEKTYNVTSISSQAFSGCTGLTTITIPNSVTSIGYKAFSDCTGLTTITIPNSVTSIGSSAFSGCTGLTNITIPESVTNIDGSAFEGTAWYNNLSDGVIYINNILYKYKGTMPENTRIAIKEGTISISGRAFVDCTGLKSITIPEGVTSIGRSAFYGCTGLTYIELPSTITSIGACAFYHDYYNNNYNYISRTIKSNAKTPPTLDSSVFTCDVFCYNELTLEVPLESFFAYQAVEGWSKIVDDYFESWGESSRDITYKGSEVDGVYYLPTSETEVKVVSTNKSPEEWIPNPSEYTGEVVIPAEITVGEKTFKVTSIDDEAFYECDITSITIPEGVTSIGSEAFSGCSGLTSVTIGNSVTSIGNYAFYGCSGLTSVTIGNSVTSIGNHAFYSCSGLTSVTIPNSVTSIGNHAFYSCSGLTSVTIPNSVTSIDTFAFYCCSGLKNVTFESTIPPTIGERAFDGVYNATFNTPSLISVLAYKAIEELKDKTFAGHEVDGIYYLPTSETEVEVTLKDKNYNSYVGDVVIPAEITVDEKKYKVTSIGKSAFYNCSGLTSVTIPNSVTSIGLYAFYNCSGLTYLVLPSTITSIGGSAFAISHYYYDENGNSNYRDNITRTIKCNAKTPPTLVNNVFHCNYLTLEVPFESIPDYKAVEAWTTMEDGSITYKSKEVDGIYYLPTSETEVAVTYKDKNYNSYTSDVVIPDTIMVDSIKYNVTSIGERAFYNCNKLNGKLSLPSSITSIGEYAFSGTKYSICEIAATTPPAISSSSLSAETSLVLVPTGTPNAYKAADVWKNYTIIAEGSCDIEVTNATGGELARSILTQTRKNLQNITGLKVKGTLNSIDLELINTNMSSLLHLDITETDVTEIPAEAFKNVVTLMSIKLPSTLQTIGDYAFSGCKVLSGELILPEKLTKIGNYAFQNCSGLSGTLKIPANVTYINSYAFSGCYNINDVDMTGATKLYEIGTNAFNGCKAIESVDMAGASRLINLGTYVFSGCTGLKSVDMTGAKSLTSLSSYIFNGCNSLETILFPETLETIGNYSFYNCAKLDNLKLPAALKSINSSAFNYCTGMKSIDMTEAKSMTSLTSYLFSDLYSLETVLFPETLETIGSNTFYNCTKLNNVKLPAALKSIDSSAFYGCTGMTSIDFSACSSLTTIYGSAFYGCTGLTMLDLSACESLITIKDSAFSGCSALATINFPISLVSIGSNAFAQCTNLLQLSVPCTIPPVIENHAEPFAGVDNIACILSIPSDNFFDYYSANYWGGFVDVEGKSEVQNGVNDATDEEDGEGDSAGEGDETGKHKKHKGCKVRFKKHHKGGHSPRLMALKGVNTLAETEDVSNTSDLGFTGDGQSLFVGFGESVTYYLTPEEGKEIESVYFNDEDVTSQLVNNTLTVTVTSDMTMTSFVVNMKNASPKLAGDVNGDSEVNVTDVVKLYSYILGNTTDINESAVDLNGDGEVNVSDIVKLYSIILSSN